MVASNLEQDLKFLELAYQQARLAAQNDEVPVGAVVVGPDQQLVASGQNTRQKSHSVLGHAELNAIQQTSQLIKNWRLVNHDFYVTLEPCLMCLASLQQARVRRVVFGAWDKKGGALSLGYRFFDDPRTNHRFEVEYIEHEPSSKILSEFFLKKRKS